MFIIEKLNNNYVGKAAVLFNQYRAFYGQPTNLHLATDFILSRLANEDSSIFIARAAEDVVGFMQIYPTFSSISAQKSLILNDLFVLSDFRGQGIGQLLLNAATAYCQETGAKGLALSTAADNQTAQALYEKNGYVRDKTFFYYFKTV